MSSHHQYDRHGYPVSPQAYKRSSAELAAARYHGHPAMTPGYGYPSKHHIPPPLTFSSQVAPHADGDEDDDDDDAHMLHSPMRAPSFTSSVESSSYAGSAADEASDENDVDLITLLTEKLNDAFDPIPLDRSLAIQAQTSGMLNSKTRELIALQEEAAARLAQTRRNFLEGMRVAKEVKADLEYVHKRVKHLQKRTQQKYPVEYAMARERIPPPSS